MPEGNIQKLPKNKKELFDQLAQASIKEAYFENIYALTRQAVYIQRLDPTKIEDTIKIGQTKIGGMPDLPRLLPWPTEVNNESDGVTSFMTANEIDQKKQQHLLTELRIVNKFLKETNTKKLLPMAFLGQINLDDITKLDIDSPLPKQGMLYFFCSSNGETPIEELIVSPEGNKRSHRVIYIEQADPKKLFQRAFPKKLHKSARLPLQKVILSTGLSVETGYDKGNPKITFVTSDQDREKLNDFLGKMTSTLQWSPVIQMLGYGVGYQGYMLETAVLDLLNVQAPPSRTKEYFAYGKKAQEEVILLYQMTWLEGSIYFWILKADLVKKDFSNTFITYDGT